jgi:uncharacterized protein
MLQHVGDNAASSPPQYGNISAASIGAIQRGLLALEHQGGEKFFGEPMLNIADLMQTRGRARGRQHPRRRQADQFAQALRDVPALAALGALREPARVGDLDKPEARVLLRRGAPAVRRRAQGAAREDRAGGALIRSKGVGVYFVTQNPLDIPDTVLGQLGNRVQHALRAFTPRDQKAVKTAAETLRPIRSSTPSGDHRARRGRGAGLASRQPRKAGRG